MNDAEEVDVEVDAVAAAVLRFLDPPPTVSQPSPLGLSSWAVMFLAPQASKRALAEVNSLSSLISAFEASRFFIFSSAVETARNCDTLVLLCP